MLLTSNGAHLFLSFSCCSCRRSFSACCSGTTGAGGAEVVTDVWLAEGEAIADDVDVDGDSISEKLRAPSLFGIGVSGRFPVLAAPSLVLVSLGSPMFSKICIVSSDVGE